MKLKNLFLITIFLFLFFPLQSEEFFYSINISKLPEISELSYKNPLFRQYCEDVEAKGKMLLSKKQKEEEIPINFYKYKCKNENLFQIAARLSLRQETIATLNHLSNPSENLENTLIIFPDINAIFISEKPQLSYEIILFESFKKKFSSEKIYKLQILTEIKNKSENQKIQKQDFLSDSMNYHTNTPNNSALYNSIKENFYIFPNEKLSFSERAFFLDSKMELPLDNYIVSSDFGFRTSPISGRWLKHKGIDLASKEGNDVFTCKKGIVKKCGFDEIYGNFIIISHDGMKESLYAHLSKILVKENQIVKTKQKIGKVGTTGLSTGPHLHFEISDGNIKRNPKEYLDF